LKATQIERCFNACFSKKYQVCMVGGAEEPIYIPGDSASLASLGYREDFASSALHEAAHWCIAGLGRRRQIDFGYDYSPPPRTVKEQQKFFELEERVQALEWIFSDAACIDFHASADNLEVGTGYFQERLVGTKDELLTWIEGISGSRARVFRDCLSRNSGVDLPANGLDSKRHG
tara:strand:+ start:42 stop:566 length:525 start_codon:yes stop_codon:yes gene_type:complete